MANINEALALYNGGAVKSINATLASAARGFETMQGQFGNAFHSAYEEMKYASITIDYEGIEGAADKQAENDKKRLSINKMELLKSAMAFSDKVTNTKARLKLLVDDEGSLGLLEKKIRASAGRSRASYIDAANAVAGLRLNAGSTFQTDDEAIAFTEILNKQLAAGGADAPAAAAATERLTQAMASGSLGAEDLQSVAGLTEGVADYLGVPIERVMELAAQGEITAGIVKNAMFAMADETDQRFSQLPMTFAQVGNLFGNAILGVFGPVIDLLGQGAKFVCDNWSVIEPIFWGLAAAVGAYTAALGAKTAATWVANGAAQTFFTTLLKNPLFWIAVAVGAVVAVIYQWIQSVGGIQVAWLMFQDVIFNVWDAIKQAFMTGVYWVLNMIDNLRYGFAFVATAVQNVIGDICAGILILIEDTVNGAIDLINMLIETVNGIAGTSFAAIEHVTFGTTFALEHEAAKQTRQEDLAKLQEELKDNAAKRDADLERMRAQAGAAHADRQAEINRKMAENLAAAEQNYPAANPPDHPADNPDSFPGGGSGGGYYQPDQPYQRETAENTAAIRDSVDISEEDLKYMRDIAEREVVNRFTTAEVTINQNNTNHLASDMDLDGVMNAWTNEFAEKMLVSSEGVHV